MDIQKPTMVYGLPLNRVRLSVNLCLDEYIPMQMYKRYMIAGDKYFGWGDRYLELLCRKISRQLVESDQKLINQFGPATINNWWYAGERQWSGLRLTGCGVGTELSDHFQGRASDKIFRDYDSEEVREFIKKRWQDLGISIIEAGTSWVHTSVAWIPGQTQLKIVQP